jgi:hypothetical protein
MSADTNHNTSPDPKEFERQMFAETQIIMGAVTLSAEEAAPRLGYQGRKGLERFRAACAGGVIPAFRDGKKGQWRIHWPTVTAALFGKAKP